MYEKQTKDDIYVSIRLSNISESTFEVQSLLIKTNRKQNI